MTIYSQEVGLQELQVALYHALETTGYDVYQYLPNDAPYPFIQMGEEYVVPNHTKTKAHFEVYHVIHAFSKSKLKTQINTMNRLIIKSLTESLTLENGYYVSDFRLDNGITLLDPTEEALFHSTNRFYYRISKG